MPKTERGWSISTLQDYLEIGDNLTLFCLCHHSRKLDMAKLIETFGADFELVANRAYFLSRFRCEKCGARPFTVHVTPGNTPGMS